MQEIITQRNDSIKTGGSREWSSSSHDGGLKQLRIRSYVLRKSKITPGQLKAYESFKARYQLNLDQGVLSFSKACILEIGFGMGQSLLKMAAENPDYQFLGIEVHKPGVGAALAGIEKLRLDNLLIYHEDAINVLNQCIKDESLSKVQIFFPDPWSKTRHKKRRLIQAEFVALVAKKLKKGGILHLATDWPDYAEQMQNVVLSHTSFLMGEKLKRPLTKFEQKAIKNGMKIHDLVFYKSC